MEKKETKNLQDIKSPNFETKKNLKASRNSNNKRDKSS